MNAIGRRAELPAGWRSCAGSPNGRSATSDDRLSSPPLIRARDCALVECLDGDAKLPAAIGRSYLLLATPERRDPELKPRLRTCLVTQSQRPQPTVTP